jgi:hypothetical protein
MADEEDYTISDRVITQLAYIMGNTAENSFDDEYSDTVNAMVCDFINNAVDLLLDRIYCGDWEEAEDCEDVQTARRVISYIAYRMANRAMNSFDDEFNDTVNDTVWAFINGSAHKLTSKWVIRVPPKD